MAVIENTGTIKSYISIYIIPNESKRNNIKDKREVIKGPIGIDKRQEVVNQHSPIGDIEIDLMIGSNHKLALVVMTDRETMLTMIEKLKSKNAH